MPKFEVKSVMWECDLCQDQEVTYAEYAASAKAPTGWKIRDEYVICFGCYILREFVEG